MPYELISDGEKVPLGDRRYLLSPQDLAGLQVLPTLAELGVASLKIEGRLKSPEYVANITRVYRQALEKIANPGHGAVADVVANSRYDLEMAFSRGLHTGWFEGINNQKLVHARFGKKRGVYLGEVSRLGRDQLILKLEAPLKPGDGIVVDAGRPEDKEEGGRVYSVQQRGAETTLGFGSGDIDFRRVHIGDKLWKTSDPELDRRLRRTFATETPRFQRPVDLEVHGGVDQPLTIVARDGLGHVSKVESAMPLALAESQPLTTERLRAQFGRLGGTPFTLGNVVNHLTEDLILPLSELNRLRRDWVAQLDALRAQPKRWTVKQPPAPTDKRSDGPPSPLTDALPEPVRQEVPASGRTSDCATPELIVLVRNLPQLDVAIACGVGTVYCEFEDPKKYAKPCSASAKRVLWQRPIQPLPNKRIPEALAYSSPRLASSRWARIGS